MSKFEVGDRVRIKSWGRMVDEYTLAQDGTYIYLPVSVFVDGMKPLCGELATITSISGNGYVELKFDNEDDLNPNWQYSTSMLEKVEDEKQTVIRINDGTKLTVDNLYPTIVGGFGDLHSIDAFNYAIDDMIKTKELIKNMEEKDMNKVLELYAKRKKEEIDKKYKEKVEKDYNDLELVKQYKEIVKDFEIKMDELYNSELNAGESTIYQCYTSSEYKYALNCDIKNSIKDVYSEEYNKEIKAINDLVEEVEAQLSLSDDLEYQREVLTAYGIIDKKTGKIK